MNLRRLPSQRGDFSVMICFSVIRSKYVYLGYDLSELFTPECGLVTINVSHFFTRFAITQSRSTREIYLTPFPHLDAKALRDRI